MSQELVGRLLNFVKLLKRGRKAEEQHMFKNGDLVQFIGPGEGDPRLIDYDRIKGHVDAYGQVQGDAITLNGVRCYSVRLVAVDLPVVIVEESWLWGVANPEKGILAMLINLHMAHEDFVCECDDAEEEEEGDDDDSTI